MRESDNDFMNNNNPTAPKITEGEEKVSSVYIICAAIHYNDGKQYLHQPRNIDEGFIVAGRRHHNCFITSFILKGEQEVNECVVKDKWKITQGFLTSDDRFVDRTEGGIIAFNAMQTRDLKSLLFSEDLY
jgi:hypothetical protein